MGQRMPDEPIEYGNNCGNCFASGLTPKFVYARFSLIEQCPPPIRPTCRVPPNDRVFKCEQMAGFPCRYRYNISPWVVTILLWQSPPGQASLRLEDVDGNIYFQDMTTVCPDEGYVWTNDIVACLGLDCANGGIGVITWNPQATQLLSDLNITKGDDLFMELRPKSDGDLVYKFCRIAESTNIKILFEP